MQTIQDLADFVGTYGGAVSVRKQGAQWMVETSLPTGRIFHGDDLPTTCQDMANYVAERHRLEHDA